MQASDNQLDTGDEDFAELETILNPRPVPDSDEVEDGFDELEALLGAAMKEKKLVEAVKATRAKAKSGYGLSAEDLERIRRWELAKEWTPVANVALFHRYVCNCGFHTTIFEGLMLEQRHKADQHANRWTSQDNETENLPSKTAIRKTGIIMCQRCAGANGYSLVTDLEWNL